MAKKTWEDLELIRKAIDRLEGLGLPEKVIAELRAWYEKELRR